MTMLAGTTACVRRMTGAPVAAAATAAAAELGVWVAARSWPGSWAAYMHNMYRFTVCHELYCAIYVASLTSSMPVTVQLQQDVLTPVVQSQPLMHACAEVRRDCAGAALGCAAEVLRWTVRAGDEGTPVQPHAQLHAHAHAQRLMLGVCAQVLACARVRAGSLLTKEADTALAAGSKAAQLCPEAARVQPAFKDGVRQRAVYS